MLSRPIDHRQTTAALFGKQFRHELRSVITLQIHVINVPPERGGTHQHVREIVFLQGVNKGVIANELGDNDDSIKEAASHHLVKILHQVRVLMAFYVEPKPMLRFVHDGEHPPDQVIKQGRPSNNVGRYSRGHHEQCNGVRLAGVQRPPDLIRRVV